MHEMALREEGGIFRAFKAYINGEITPTNLGFNLKGCILGLLFRGAFLALGVPNRAKAYPPQKGVFLQNPLGWGGETRMEDFFRELEES